MFDLTAYIKSEAWVSDQFLVQHPTGIKRCSVCKKLKYSIEFADFNSESFADGKVPCCSKCARSSKKKDKIAKLLTELVECSKCKQQKPLAEYIARKGEWYEVNNHCYDCRNERFIT